VLGEAIQIEADGRSHRYRVVEISIVSPADVHVLSATEEPSVTLVTCYPFYFVGSAPQRYIIRARLDRTMQAAEGS
jgi:LPXTG-site transpeptidase (sortase) family protein